RVRRLIEAVRSAEPPQSDEVAGMAVQGARRNGPAEGAQGSEVLTAVGQNGAIGQIHRGASLHSGRVAPCPPLGPGWDCEWESTGTLGIGPVFPVAPRSESAAAVAFEAEAFEGDGRSASAKTRSRWAISAASKSRNGISDAGGHEETDAVSSGPRCATG